MRGKRRAGAVSKVGTGQGDDYREYDDRATVERLIMANNAARFRLTEDTPPMTEPLLSDLGYLADTEAAAQILEGTFICPPGTDDYTRDFLRILQRPTNVDAADKIDTSFSVSDFPELLEKGKGANVFVHFDSALWSLQGRMQKRQIERNALSLC
jgi:hypothetical protein